MRPAWLEINLDAIGHNLSVIRGLIGPKVGFIPVVKGNGYGHGLVEVAQRVVRENPLMLAVAIIDEALILRKAGITAPILVLGAPPADAAEDFIANDVTPPINDALFAEALEAAAIKLGKTAHAHVKIDSGMGRQGCLGSESAELFRYLARQSHISADGIFTHFALTSDAEFTKQQVDCFVDAFTCGEEILGRRFPLRHAAASAPIARKPQLHFDAVRPGIIMYGGGFDPETLQRLDLRPALAMKAKVALVKTREPGESVGYNRAWIAKRATRVALLPIGYCDGYPRALSHHTEVLIRGRRAPVIGLISMDALTVDVTDVPGVCIGDEAVLIGPQGNERIWLGDVAERCNTCSQEILSRIGPRLPRVYV